MKNNSLIVRDLKIQPFHANIENSALTSGISLSLNAGQLLLIQGASGSGKSMLLKVIAGILKPVSGKIRINDRAIGDYRQTPSIYIGNASHLRSYRSVRHHVRRWARASGNPELYEAAINYFELEQVAAGRLNRLSDGYRQRVLLTRLVTMPSALWLLDDPFVHLDEVGSALLNALIQTRLEQHGIVLLATHQNFSGARVKTLNLSEPPSQDAAIH